MKFSDLGWNITEEEYRALNRVSYSSIAAFLKYSYEGILRERPKTKAMDLGTLVDNLVTNPIEAEKFAAADYSLFPTNEKDFSLCQECAENIEEGKKEIEEEKLLELLNKHQWRTSWKDTTRIEKFHKFYDSAILELLSKKDKILVESDIYNKAQQCAFAAKMLLKKTFKDCEFAYQFKIADTIEEIPLKCMIDIIAVDHKSQRIYPIDLKTTSNPEYSFVNAVVKYRYDIQARLYHRMLTNCIKGTEYENYYICDFRFLVVNTITMPKPAWWIWNAYDYNTDFEVYDRKGNKIKLEEPVKVAKIVAPYILQDSYGELSEPIEFSNEEEHDILKWISKT